jgi:septin family protein
MLNKSPSNVTPKLKKPYLKKPLGTSNKEWEKYLASGSNVPVSLERMREAEGKREEMVRQNQREIEDEEMRVGERRGKEERRMEEIEGEVGKREWRGNAETLV